MILVFEPALLFVGMQRMELFSIEHSLVIGLLVISPIEPPLFSKALLLWPMVGVTPRSTYRLDERAC